jgi:general secretion pathway protein M
MSDLLASVQKWFAGLSQREKYLVLGGAALAVAIVLFGLLLPLERHVSQLQDRVRTKQADAAWMQSVAPQIRTLRENAARSGGGGSLVVVVDRVAHETGIARSIAGSQPATDGTLSVRLEQVPFDSMVNWAAVLVQQHRVRVVSANIESSAAVGLVSATVVLRGP